MPTTEENLRFWDSAYHWRRRGDEWSATWGDTGMQWHATILPRIHTFVPAGTILEIGPGFGRWSKYLKDLCGRLILVDISEKCVAACDERFASSEHVTAHVNDGASLDVVPDESIDFVFSFDSLVHAEEEVIEVYLREISRKLEKNGIGIIHHSNAGELPKYHSLINRSPVGRGLLTRIGLIETVDHWRAYSMTACKFEMLAERAGLQCVSQETVNWLTRPGRMIDCFSVFTRKDSNRARPNRLLRNGGFMQEARNASMLSELYGTNPRRRKRQADQPNNRAAASYRRLKAAVPVPIKQKIKDALQQLRKT